MINKTDFNIIVGDCLKSLKRLPSESVQCIITSPPYYGLRDYGTARWEGGDPNCNHYRDSKFSENTSTGHKTMGELGEAVGDAIYKRVCPKCGAIRIDEQIGLEETPEEYVNRLVEVFREAKRVLKNDGTLWLNLGDSYAGGAGRWGKENNMSEKESTNKGALLSTPKWERKTIKQKDLIGIPWMVAFALRADGWWLRHDIIFSKLNPMPESVKDRCTKSYEYIFLLSKSPKYLFNYEAIQEVATGYDGRKDIVLNGSPKYDGQNIMPQNNEQSMAKGGHDRWKFKNMQDDGGSVPIRNKRDVWNVATLPYKGAHFATYPIKLIEPCVLAGSNVGDTILDSFNGSGTTGICALMHDRKYIGLELNPKYVELSYARYSEAFEGIKTTKEVEEDYEYEVYDFFKKEEM